MPDREVAFFDLARQVAAVRDDIDEAIGATLTKGWFVLGPAVADFEAEFAAWCGADQAVGVASGTDAITVALRAVGVGPGDEVITAANTCVPTIAGIERSGANPVLADVEPDTLTLDAASVEGAVTEHTRAVVPVHLYGQTADMDAIGAVAERHSLKVVEDAAQAHGATFDGRRTGTLGDAAAFSFYPTKNLGALGDGGAVVTDDTDVAERARMLRNYGYRERDLAATRGYNSRLDALQAAILSKKLTRLDAWNERRRSLAGAYLEALEDVQLALPAVRAQSGHAWHLFVVRSPARDALRDRLAAEGIQGIVHYPRPIHHQPAYTQLNRPGQLAVSEAACREVLSLPLYPELRDDELERVVEGVRRAGAAP